MPYCKGSNSISSSGASTATSWSRSMGSKKGAVTMHQKMPARAMMIPAGNRSKNLMSASGTRFTASKFVEDPMEVRQAESMVTKDNGIINCATGKSWAAHQRFTIGIMTATSGVLLKTLPKAPSVKNSLVWATWMLFGEPRKNFIIGSRAWVLSIAAETTKSTPTAKTPSFESPCSSSVVEMIWHSANIVAAASSTTSAGSPLAIRVMETARVSRTT
mmetsp:Transcript_77617/g.177738  ORF Transcript_77617/g.177738 Transcript_77617/m.177738 type:complete len:217 (-) Transcript_77617:13-663(-)